MIALHDLALNEILVDLLLALGIVVACLYAVGLSIVIAGMGFALFRGVAIRPAPDDAEGDE